MPPQLICLIIVFRLLNKDERKVKDALKPTIPDLTTLVNINRFHEGLFTLKSFPNVLVGFRKFWLETVNRQVRCVFMAELFLMAELFQFWTHRHSKKHFIRLSFNQMI